MNSVLFGFLAVLIVVSAVGVVLNRNPVRSALCLVATLFLLAVLFVFLDAHLVAALQIVVYAGAIMVLFLFVIMLLNLQTEPREQISAPMRALVGTAGLVFLGVVGGALATSGGAAADKFAAPVPPGFGTSVAVSERLFTQFLLPFEITSLLLLVAIVGAVVVAKRKLE